ncbi:unnamed protein product [Dibothriocephalus latus]|uniref:Uncharacterized protein n=1 Tax=Dibothriocephalus latus TaxID=60516 RepID=A0A3P6QWR7_DIBLA|nr:unnamed protein product [Dibothriocephalus latus]
MMSDSKAASKWTRRHASSRIPLLKHSTLRHLDGDTGKSESSCQVPPLPSEACSRLPRHSKAVNCEATDYEVCSITGRSRPLRKPRKKTEQTDDESRDPEVSRDATMTVRRRRTKYRTRTLETADFSRELRGLDVIRSKLENMTDDQWNRVLAILSGNAGDGRPTSPPPPLPPAVPHKHTEDSLPWPRVPRGFSPACVERTVEPRETEPPPRGLVRKRERRRKCLSEGTHRHRQAAAEEEKAEGREGQGEGLGADHEPTMPSIDSVLTEKPPHSQTHHPVRRTREVHRRRERAEGDLPNYYYRARTEMQAEKIFGKH